MNQFMLWLSKRIKEDSKSIWTIILLIGGVLGYSLPEDISSVLPSNDASIQKIQTEVDILKTEIDTLSRAVLDLMIKIHDMKQHHENNLFRNRPIHPQSETTLSIPIWESTEEIKDVE